MSLISSPEVLIPVVTLLSPSRTVRRLVTGPLKAPCLRVQCIVTWRVFLVTLVLCVVTPTWLSLSFLIVRRKLCFLLLLSR